MVMQISSHAQHLNLSSLTLTPENSSSNFSCKRTLLIPGTAVSLPTHVGVNVQVQVLKTDYVVYRYCLKILMHSFKKDCTSYKKASFQGKINEKYMLDTRIFFLKNLKNRNEH